MRVSVPASVRNRRATPSPRLAAQRATNAPALAPPLLGPGHHFGNLAVLHRAPAPPAAAPATPAASDTVIFVLRAPDDGFTQEVTDFTKNTLGKEIIEVDNINQVIEQLEELGQAGGLRFKKVRIIGHGTTTGSIKMTPEGETDRRFVTADELAKLAEDKQLRERAAGVMAEDATVEFWGCFVGSEKKTGAAMSTLFQSKFRSTKQELKTREHRFAKTKTEAFNSSAEVDEYAKEHPEFGRGFDNWLLHRYEQLAANGDIAPVKKREDRIKLMREMFDRSSGNIRELIVEKGGVQTTRRAWGKLWSTTKVKGKKKERK